MRRVINILLVIAFVVLGFFFGRLNADRVPVDYFFLQTEWPLALSLAVFFFVGALLGGLLTWLGSWWALRRRLRAAQRAQLRSEPVTSPAGSLPKPATDE